MGSMKTKMFIFEKNSITFTLDRDSKVMVNATEMARVFDRKVEAFMRNEDTQNFISEALKSEYSRFLKLRK
jgi:hypothetical protein